MTTTAYHDSLVFAHREVIRTRRRVERAFEAASELCEMDSPALQNLCAANCAIALRQHRTALGKRAFEIRQLTNS